MDMNKLENLRHDGDIVFGNIMEASGDRSLGFFLTDKGYRLILDEYNMNRIYKHFNKENMEEAPEQK